MKCRLLICLFIIASFNGYGQSCSLNVALSQSAPAICSGFSVTLAATLSGGTAPFTYAWSTGETTQVINVNKGGTYTVTVTDNTPGCQPVKKSLDIIVSPTPNPPTASNVIICANNSATLSATAPGGYYQWYDSAVGGNFLASGPSYITPLLSKTTTYYVQTTVGGCTSLRTAVSAVLAGNPTVSDAGICAGNTATLSVSGGSSYTWYDAGGNAVSTAASYTTPVLYNTTTYNVVAVINGCASGATPVTAYVTPLPQAPTAANTSICAGSSAALHASGPVGVFSWYVTPTGGTPLITSPDYTTPPLNATTTYYVQSSSGNCISTRTPVTVTVNSIPAPPAAQTDSVCYGTSAALTAGSDPSVTYQWYDAAAGGNLVTKGAIYSTPTLTSSTTYYVLATNGTCTSSRSALNVVVKAQLPMPSAPGAIVCSGSSASLTASGPAGIYRWYDAPTAGNLLATGNSFTSPPVSANVTYYVEFNAMGCVSSRTAVNVVVQPPLTPPTVPDLNICSGNTAGLIASGSVGGYSWYDSATGGNLLSTAQIFITPALTSNTTYYVASTNNTCSSARIPVTVSVDAIPTAPAASGTTICTGNTATLTATVSSGTIQWYDAAVAGNLLSTNSSYATPVLTATTIYYAQNTIGQCVSSRTPVTVTVNPGIDPQFQYSSGTFCASGPNVVPKINNPSGGVFSVMPNGLTFVSTTTGEINISGSTPGVYMLSFTGADACPHTTTTRISITMGNSSFSYNGPYCQDGVNPFPNFMANSSAGVFSATPAGLVFVDPTTGEINLAASKSGSYNVTNNIAASGSCTQTTSSYNVVINQAVSVNAGPSQNVPTGTQVQLSGTVSGGATTGTWSGGTGSFSNTSKLNAVYTPGAGESVAKLILTSTNASASCGLKSSAVTITFSATPASPTVANASTCSGSNVTLSATAPGGSYQWYDAVAGGTLLQTGAVYVTPSLIATTIYYVQTTVNGIVSNRTAVTVTVNPIPAAPAAAGIQICKGNTATLTANGSVGSYLWYDAPTGGNILSTTSSYLTTVLNTNTTYYVEAVVNGCASTRTPVNISVTNVPNITSASSAVLCSGTALNYAITSDIPSAAFLWSRAQVAGISNLGITNQSSATISESLLNTTDTAIKVTYVIVPTNGNCSGNAFNYVVTVNPSPIVSGTNSIAICNGDIVNYDIKFNTLNTNFTWKRDSVAGVSNAAVSGQTASTIKEVLFNTTNTPVKVTYVILYSTSTCAANPFNLIVTVNPQVNITSATSGIACSRYPQTYNIKSNIPTATFIWSRPAVTGINNAAVSNQTSPTINEALDNITNAPIYVTYIITPYANGCTGSQFYYYAKVNPKIVTPTANANSPVCIGSIIHLRTPPVDGATFLWTGPNGYTSTAQNPDITNVSDANTGVYKLVNIIGGCNSPPDSVFVLVNHPSIANAGPDQKVCFDSKTVTLAGSVTGGSNTGIWTTLGSGTFTPESNVLNALYNPSDSDKMAGSVKLLLTSTSKDDCAISSSAMTITFGKFPAVSAGPNQTVCSQDISIKLAGKLFINSGVTWSTSGTGTFSPSANQLDANYIPSVADAKNGAVTLTLLANVADACHIAADKMIIDFLPPPVLNAGGIRYVLKNKTITLAPTVNDSQVKYLWSPNVGISDVTIKNPVVTGNTDITYTLTVTNSLGCMTQDQTKIVVSPEINVDNTFTPNGDGINDLWNITGLIAYQDATVDIYTRYGKRVYHSTGYNKAWDGTYNQQALPVGVYYYVINTNYNGVILSGYVTIIR